VTERWRWGADKKRDMVMSIRISRNDMGVADPIARDPKIRGSGLHSLQRAFESVLFIHMEL
jgi:hypothetical protein